VSNTRIVLIVKGLIVTSFVRRTSSYATLSFFVGEHDLCFLLDRLNAEAEMAFMVTDDLLGLENAKPDQPPISSWSAFHLVPASNAMNMEEELAQMIAASRRSG
jgi:hypothetical protein